MRVLPLTVVERMIATAGAAARLRICARTDPENRAVLLRAADRYSQLIAILADEMLQDGGAA